jgi:hypothetical protein
VYKLGWAGAKKAILSILEKEKMRRSADQLSGSLSLVYIAGNTVDAGKVERTLTEHGVDYALSLEPFASTSVMRGGEHVGLFVYVPSAQHRSCREMLERSELMDTVGFDEALLMEKTDGA